MSITPQATEKLRFGTILELKLKLLGLGIFFISLDPILIIPVPN